MSFALQYRRKLQAQQREDAAERKANEGFVAMPVDDAADTRASRRRVFFALVIAGGFLAVFNSSGLVQYTYDMADSRVGRALIVASERWHGLMEDRKVTRVVEEIRDRVMIVRETNWQDFASGFSTVPETQPSGNPAPPKVLPAKTAPPLSPDTQEAEKPNIAIPTGPVMRASADVTGAETR